MSDKIQTGDFTMVHFADGSQAYIHAEFDGENVKLSSTVKKQSPPEISEEPKLTIVCPFCNAPYTAKMEMDFSYSMGSEWTGIYGKEKSLKIYCDNCKKLVYTKEED